MGRATWQSRLISDPGAQNFVKTERGKQRQRIRSAFSPWFEHRCLWFFGGLCKQALRYALIVLPYGQHSASLRACLHNRRETTNTYGEI